jgi:hypothetical protein
MDTTLTAELSSRSVACAFAFEVARLTSRVTEGVRLDSNEQIASAAGDFLTGLAKAERAHRYLAGDLESQRTAVATTG